MQRNFRSSKLQFFEVCKSRKTKKRILRYEGADKPPTAADRTAGLTLRSTLSLWLT